MLARHGFLGSLIFSLAACTAQDPQTALERFVAESERAVEARDTGYFREIVSEDYRDARGNDKDRLIGMIRGYFLAHQSIDVVVRLQSADIIGGNAAELVLMAGVLGRQAGGGLLGGFEGRLYRLELELAQAEGDWRLIGARWEDTLEGLIEE